MRRLPRLVRLGLECFPPMRPRAPRPAPLTGCVLPRAVPRPSPPARAVAVAVARALRLTASRWKGSLSMSPGWKVCWPPERFSRLLSSSLQSTGISLLAPVRRLPLPPAFPLGDLSGWSPRRLPSRRVGGGRRGSESSDRSPAPAGPQPRVFLRIPTPAGARSPGGRCVPGAWLAVDLSLWRLSLRPGWEALLFVQTLGVLSKDDQALGLFLCLLDPRVSPEQAKAGVPLLSDSSPCFWNVLSPWM